MASTTLPTPRAFVTSLIQSLTTHHSQNAHTPQTSTSTSTTLKNARPTLRSTILTLHVLFPNELLPALDVLDRNLVTHLRLKNSSCDFQTYFVRSAQQPPKQHRHRKESRYTNSVRDIHYQVSLGVWNCSCPAFAFSTFPASTTMGLDKPENYVDVGVDRERDAWQFGGVSHDGGAGNLAICKHLLACVLVEQCPALFAGDVEDREVEREEYTGWCAGWGS